MIDFGDLTSGDPATDLSVAWMLFGADDRRRFRTAAGGCDDATWVRARGNALSHALACLSASDNDPLIGAIGRRTLDIVLADTQERR
ncbi:MAG: phosphotransferase [Ornithinimicrobium sp.]